MNALTCLICFHIFSRTNSFYLYSFLGQLILPEALKLLPIYTIGAFKCDAINGGAELSPDEKAYAQIVTLGTFILIYFIFKSCISII